MEHLKLQDEKQMMSHDYMLAFKEHLMAVHEVGTRKLLNPRVK